MVDSIGPGKIRPLPGSRLIAGDEPKKSSKPRNKTAPESTDKSHKEKRKGTYIDDQA